MELPHNRDMWHVKYESPLLKFENQKESYATYILCEKKGTRGKHGCQQIYDDYNDLLLLRLKINKDSDPFFILPERCYV